MFGVSSSNERLKSHVDIGAVKRIATTTAVTKMTIKHIPAKIKGSFLIGRTGRTGFIDGDGAGGGVAITGVPHLGQKRS